MSDRDSVQLVSGGHKIPFSKRLLASTLTATGLPTEQAFTVALDVETRLLTEPDREIDVERFRHLVESVLAEGEGEPYLRRYRMWNKLAREDKPIVVLIGGATGVGKSTIAAQVADRLGLVRMISTDSIREVMRAFFSESLMPAIHYSSYEAGQGVRIPIRSEFDSPVVGFIEQVDVVNVGILALLDRAIEERTSIIVEGVHMVPGMLACRGATQRTSEVVLLEMVVAVTDTKLHRSHFMVREQETSGRRAIARYLNNFEEIRKIQDFILERAAAEGTLVVNNLNIDDTVDLVVDALYDVIDRSEEGGHAGE
ncbi:MAG: zeta toxin family protein [Thermoleophilia bacterium]|nr:zeta toxin family protein [Thermoleophilia bacterium]